MAKCLISMSDIQKAAQTGEKRLSLPPDCIVTPMARDEADRLGIAIDIQGASVSAPLSPSSTSPAGQTDMDKVAGQVIGLLKEKLPPNLNRPDLERVVREVVQKKLAGKISSAVAPTVPPAGSSAGASGVQLIEGKKLIQNSVAKVGMDGKVVVAEAIRCGADAALAGCYMAWEKASFTRTLDEPEIDIVIEGELGLTVDGKNMTAKPGDMIYLPKGAEVTYQTSAKVMLACVDYTR